MKQATPPEDTLGRSAPMPHDTATAEADAQVPPRRFLRGMTTFQSFQYRDYSYFFFGAVLSNIGTWMQTVAIGWLVYELTKSSTALGTVNFLSGIPVTLLIIFTGTLADRFDRRKLLIWSQVILMAQALALGILTQLDMIALPSIYGLTLAAGVVSAFMFPAWQAMIPDLVPRESLLNAIALSSAQFNAARLVGPMLGAAVFAIFGVTEVFYANAISFLFVIWALWIIRPRQAVHEQVKEPGRSMFTEGLRYAVAHRRVYMHLLTAAMITVFGMPMLTLLPVIAAEILGLGSTGYSTLMGINGAGALIGALVVASLPRTVRRDNIVRWGTMGVAVAVIAISLSHTLWLTAVLLLLNGAAFLSAVSSINTNLQIAAPPAIRGRVMSLFVLSFMGLMPVGALVFGALGDVIGVPQAIFGGGVVLIVFATLMLVRPALLCERSGECAEVQTM